MHEDNGDPHNHPALWISPDIWVRNSAESSTGADRYTNEHQHVQAQWSSNPANTPYVFVKVRNRSCTTVEGYVDLKYAMASTGLSWPSSFNPVNSQNPGNISIGPGEEVVFRVQWTDLANMPDPNTPLSPNHYCILARFISQDDPIINEDNTNSNGGLLANVKNINNIALKNVSLVTDARPQMLAFGNPHTPHPMLCNLVPVFHSPNGVDYFNEVGTIDLNLGRFLYQKWASAGKQGQGFIEGNEKYRHTLPDGNFHYHQDLIASNNPYEIRLVNMNSSLNGFLLDSAQAAQMSLKFHFNDSPRSASAYEMDIKQESLNDLGSFSAIGGERYLINPPQCSTVSAGPNQVIFAFCNATLTAVPDISGATYVWRDQKTGEKVGDGRQITVNPAEIEGYEVEMKTTEGCVSYAFVTVTRNILGGVPCVPSLGRLAGSNSVAEAELQFAAYPNPFHDQLTIVYRLPEHVSSAEVSIVEAASGKTVHNTTLSSGSYKIELQNISLSPGMYLCQVRSGDGSTKVFKLVKVN